jgi:hypothetical protein
MIAKPRGRSVIGAALFVRASGITLVRKPSTSDRCQLAFGISYLLAAKFCAFARSMAIETLASRALSRLQARLNCHLFGLANTQPFIPTHSGALTMSRTMPRTRKLGMETLEKREVCAGNVTAFVDWTGTLQVIGDGAANSVDISEVAPNYYRVRGYNTRDASGLNTVPTTINGAAAERIFLVPKDQVTIDLGDGNDILRCHDAVMGLFDINMGNGHDSVFLQSLNGYASGLTTKIFMGADAGVDVVDVNASYFAGSLYVSTGDGNDFVDFTNTQINGFLSVYAGAGYDYYHWYNTRASFVLAWVSFESTY